MASFARQVVGVDAQRISVAVEANRREDRHDVEVEQLADEFHVQLVHLAGEKLVLALDDAHGHGAHRVAQRALQARVREALDDLVAHLRRGLNGELQRRRVRRAAAVNIGDGDLALRGEALELPPDAVHQHDADVQAAQHRDVRQQIRKIFVVHDAPVHRQHKDMVAKLRDIAQDAAQVRRLERARFIRPRSRARWWKWCRRHSSGSKSRFSFSGRAARCNEENIARRARRGNDASSCRPFAPRASPRPPPPKNPRRRLSRWIWTRCSRIWNWSAGCPATRSTPTKATSPNARAICRKSARRTGAPCGPSKSRRGSSPSRARITPSPASRAS